MCVRITQKTRCNNSCMSHIVNRVIFRVELNCAAAARDENDIRSRFIDQYIADMCERVWHTFNPHASSLCLKNNFVVRVQEHLPYDRSLHNNDPIHIVIWTTSAQFQSHSIHSIETSATQFWVACCLYYIDVDVFRKFIIFSSIFRGRA